MPSGQPPVAIILVNWNGWEHAVECLDSLLAQDYPDFHVFIVDNDSADCSVERIAAWCANPARDGQWRRHENAGSWSLEHDGRPVPCRVLSGPEHSVRAAECGNVTIIRSGGNLGFAGGCNTGIRLADTGRFGFFWLLNTDTVVARNALEELVRRAGLSPRVGMTGSTILYYDRPRVVQCLGGARLDLSNMSSRLIGTGREEGSILQDRGQVERDMAYVMGASMLVSREFVHQVGLMQEDYFLYYEEIDWAMRGRGRFDLAYAPASRVFHKSGASSSKGMAVFSAGYYYRNRIRFAGRFFPERLLATWFGLAVELARHALRRRWGHALVVASTLCSAHRLAASVRRPIEG